jgi:AraC family transcriptional activator of pobA
VDKQVVTLQDNSVICTGPNSVICMDVQEINSGSIILFSDSFFSMRYNENILYNFDCLKYNNICQQTLGKEDTEEWQFYMKLMSREYQSTSKDAQSLLRSYMNIILSILNRSNALAKNSQEVRTIKDKKMIAFEALIESKFRSAKLPSEYANDLYITVNYLNRICQEKRGLSSGEMIRRRVILEAERLLFHTYNSIAEIALELGFEHASYFTTFFKKHTGLTPDNFRKTNK